MAPGLKHLPHNHKWGQSPYNHMEWSGNGFPSVILVQWIRWRQGIPRTSKLEPEKRSPGLCVPTHIKHMYIHKTYK